MVSEKKLQANRLNATKSTGPRTPEGKAISSQNGLKHGLFSKRCPILPGENEQEFRELHHALVHDLNPSGILQHELVWDLAINRWKIHRLSQIESLWMKQEQDQIVRRHEVDLRLHYNRKKEKPACPSIDPIELLAQEMGHSTSRFHTLELHRQRLQRQMHTLLRELRKLREETGQGDVGWASPTTETVGDAHPTEEFENPNPPKEQDAIGECEPTKECKELVEQEIESSAQAHPGLGEADPGLQESDPGLQEYLQTPASERTREDPDPGAPGADRPDLDKI